MSADPLSTQEVSGIELDTRVRAILRAVTPETLFTAARQLHELGFGAVQSVIIVRAILENRYD